MKEPQTNKELYEYIEMLIDTTYSKLEPVDTSDHNKDCDCSICRYFYKEILGEVKSNT